jgi:hypothetical protein
MEMAAESQNGYRRALARTERTDLLRKLHGRKESRPVARTVAHVVHGAVVGGALGTVGGAGYGIVVGALCVALYWDPGQFLFPTAGFALSGAAAGTITGAFAGLFEGAPSNEPEN